jgi:hypothetical protein
MDGCTVISERYHNDVNDAQVMAMRAILFTAKRDFDAAYTSLDTICASHAELTAIIGGLNP